MAEESNRLLFMVSHAYKQVYLHIACSGYNRMAKSVNDIIKAESRNERQNCGSRMQDSERTINPIKQQETKNT